MNKKVQNQMKVVINEKKSGKSYAKALEDNDAKRLFGKKIGETIKGESIDLPGYELTITGGNDTQGFAMRKSVNGNAKRKLLLSGGVGFKPDAKGLRKKKTVRGNALEKDIAQVNMIIIKEGKTPLSEIFKKEEKKEGEA